MSEYGNDFVVLVDDEGNEVEFEHISTIEHNGKTYCAFIPAEMAESDSGEAEVVLLRIDNEGTEDEVLVTIDDDDEANEVFEIFLAQNEEELFGDEESEAN